MRTVLNFLFVCGLSVTAASATSLQFVQDGWSTGAMLSAVFTGEDTDGDGAITLPRRWRPYSMNRYSPSTAPPTRPRQLRSREDCC